MKVATTQNRAGPAEMPRTVADFEPVMRNRLEQVDKLDSYVFISSAADDEVTMRRNVAAFSWVRIRPAPKPLNAAALDAATTLLGERLPFPILVAPMSGQSSLDPEEVGDANTFRGATAAKTTMLLSYFGAPYAAVAPAAPGRLIAQFFPEVVETTIRAAVDAGTPAVVLTVDSPLNPRVERAHRIEARNWKGEIRFQLERWRDVVRNAPTNGDIQEQTRSRYRVSPRFTRPIWDVIESIRAVTAVPVFLKGILSPDDARIAVERGINGIIVSNHGGRVLDHCESTLEALPEVAAAVAGRVPVFLDSGVRTGEDVFKALALGASAVLVGRPVLWGLGAFGAAGVQRVLEIMQADLVETMARAGTATLASIGSGAVDVNFP